MRFSSVKWSSTLNGLHTSYSLKSPTASAPLHRPVDMGVPKGSALEPLLVLVMPAWMR